MWGAIISAVVALSQAGIMAGVNKKKGDESRAAAQTEHDANIQASQEARGEAVRGQEKQSLLQRQSLESQKQQAGLQQEAMLEQEESLTQGRRQATLSGMGPNVSRTAEDLSGKMKRRL